VSPFSETIDRVTSQLGEFQHEFYKAEMKQALAPYIDALEEQGFGRDEWQYLVDNDISFWDAIMPAPWKERFTQAARDDMGLFNQVKTDLETFGYLLIESLVEIRLWFPRVLTKDWCQKEASRIIKDLDAST
jgi:hypothetical protein